MIEYFSIIGKFSIFIFKSFIRDRLYSTLSILSIRTCDIISLRDDAESLKHHRHSWYRSYISKPFYPIICRLIISVNLQELEIIDYTIDLRCMVL